MDPQIDERVAKLLGGLKKVEAPENFESGVLARLSTPLEQGSKFGFLRLAIPTAALAGLALFLFFSGYFGGDVPSVEVLSAANRTEATEKGTQDRITQNTVVAENKAQPQGEFRAPEVADAKPSPQSSMPPFETKKRLGGRGSYDIGAGPVEQISPKGINSNSRPSADPAIERQIRRPSIPASDVLRYTGAAAEFRGDGWLVSSVVPNSVSERIGMRPGDVIVYLNDVRLDKATAFPSGVDVKIIRVSRNGKLIDLKF